MSVYFATCREINAVKIGCSFEPYTRLRELQVCCPLPIVLEAVMYGKHREERELHARFAADRIRGEWFTLTEAIETLIKANPAPPAPTDEERLAVDRAVRARPTAAMRAADARRREMEIERAQAERLRAGQRYLAKREASGDIIFPFREQATA